MGMAVSSEVESWDRLNKPEKGYSREFSLMLSYQPEREFQWETRRIGN
jgi:hypothetical protein